jgi:hypothetical protein
MTLHRITPLACATSLLFLSPCVTACAASGGPVPVSAAEPVLDWAGPNSDDPPAEQVAPAEVPALPAGELPRDTSQRFEYLSDFFVFVGREQGAEPNMGKGLVLAFDANRGRDRAKFDAEHFAVLWVEDRGWVELDVTGTFAGAEEHFVRTFAAPLPSTDRATLTGTGASGLALELPKVALRLTAEPTVVEADQRHARDGFVTGSSAGMLTLGDRTFVGVVHHEFTYLAGINPLAKTYTDLFGDGFHSVYALVGEDGALRQHRSGGRLEPLIGEHSGYYVAPGATRGEGRLEGLSLSTSKKSLGGLFRWPGRYETKSKLGDRALSLRVDLKDRESLINYVFGGVAIAIAKGELTEGGVKRPVLGFSLIVL